MNARVVFVLAAVAGSGCSNQAEPPPAEPPPVPAPTPVMRDASILASHMAEHFTAIANLQREIASGRLAEAKQQARWLLEHEPPAREGWPIFVGDMQNAAREVLTAQDLPTASVLAARLGRTCSRCHEHQRAVVTFAWELPPDDSPVLAAQMKRHQWAAARLWEGLVGPSSEMWNEGASVLSTSRLDAVAAAKGLPRGDVAALAGKVRELAVTAIKTDDHDERTALYGQLLSTCAGCHQLVRPAR